MINNNRLTPVSIESQPNGKKIYFWKKNWRKKCQQQQLKRSETKNGKTIKTEEEVNAVWKIVLEFVGNTYTIRIIVCVLMRTIFGLRATIICTFYTTYLSLSIGLASEPKRYELLTIKSNFKRCYVIFFYELTLHTQKSSTSDRNCNDCMQRRPINLPFSWK